MTIKDIVPDVSLCRRIPKGFFADSIFVYYPVKDKDGSIAFYMPVFRDAFTEETFPAPTLQEIIWGDLKLPLQGNANTALHQWLKKHEKDKKK